MENDVRLIDANALNFRYAHMIYPDGTESLGYTAFVTSAQVKDAPTVDAESLRPVGRWEYPLGMAWGYVCSVCGAKGDVIEHNYCSHCGAYMKGAADHGTE